MCRTERLITHSLNLTFAFVMRVSFGVMFFCDRAEFPFSENVGLKAQM